MEKYYKILREDMVMRGFKYKVGLNVDTKELKEDIYDCGAGLHFSDKDNILYFLDYGELICEVKIPEGEKVFKYGEEDKSKAHSIILGEPRDLRKVETWEWMKKECIEMHSGSEFALRICSRIGYYDAVKFLIEDGADVNAARDCALIWASNNGNLEIVKLLVENGANIHSNDDKAFRYAAEEGKLEVVKYLVDKGADIHALDDYAFVWSSYNEHNDVVNFLNSIR